MEAVNVNITVIVYNRLNILFEVQPLINVIRKQTQLKESREKKYISWQYEKKTKKI